MVNKNYQAGRRREYAIMNKLKEEGFTVLRTAGSHGFADIVAIDPKIRRITFIQVKPISMSVKAKGKLEEDISWIQGDWKVGSCVVSYRKDIK